MPPPLILAGVVVFSCCSAAAGMHFCRATKDRGDKESPMLVSDGATGNPMSQRFEGGQSGGGSGVVAVELVAGRDRRMSHEPNAEQARRVSVEISNERQRGESELNPHAPNRTWPGKRRAPTADMI